MSDDPCASLASAAQRLARRIARGAALWVAAPGFEDHARHVAVEFVHPASVGAMHVPATAIVGDLDRIVDIIRCQARAGDVIVSLGQTNDSFTSELSVRAIAWGLEHLHIGWAQDPSVGLDPHSSYGHLGESAASERLLTRAYHLLWELTFILLQNDRMRSSDETQESSACAVCSDGATISEVSELCGVDNARVRNACGIELVDISLLDGTAMHDLVLVHAGTAIRKLTLAPYVSEQQGTLR